jgi:hypothetical protein
MLQKIRSNRDPEKTIWSELRPIVAPYFSKANAGFSSVLKKQGKVIYAGMVVVIIVSAILSFTVFSTTDNPLDNPLPSTTGIQSPHRKEENLLPKIEMLQSTLMLRKSIDSLLSKKVLTHQDSLSLVSAITKLEAIEKQINLKK